MKWIDTTIIRNWAQRRDCQEHLPLLVRKLIRATSNSIKSISFPSGENVLIGGWDGVLNTSEGTDYIPKGISLWEFGTNSEVKGKADDDYKKRSASTLGFDPKEATYVFVTPRLWTNKKNWIDEKKAEGIWKDVRVYDAQDLEEWIDTAPTVGAWLAVKHLGITPNEGVQPADVFWEEWSTGKHINFVPAVVLAGRLLQSKTLLEKSVEPNVVAIQANSKEEALAFIVATFLDTPDRAEDFFSRCLIVDRIEAFRELSVMDKPYYLLCRFDDDSALNKAKKNGHTIIVPLGLDRTDEWSEKIVLPPLHRDAFVAAMKASGLSEEKAEDISKKSSRNLIVVRRQLEFKRLNPDWATPENVRAIIPVILAGRWDEDYEGDRNIIATLAGEDYESYIRKLQPWAFAPDAPIVKIGNTWRLTSPMDAWTHTARYLTRDDFNKLAGSTMEILSVVNSKYDMTIEEQQRTLWYTNTRKHSTWLREGLIQSLILISVFGEKLQIDLPNQPTVWVDHIFYKLLSSTDPKLWKSLDHELPLIAEASPIAFITSVEKLLDVEESPIIGLFDEIPGYINSESYHTGMLWALENLAWMPEHLSSATSILAGLTAKDPGGQLANRPANSLTEIFKAWHPQTFSSPEARTEALKTIVRKYPDVGHTLLVQLLPSSHGIAHETHKMRWRLSESPRSTGIAYDEIYKAYGATLDLLIEHFDNSEEQFKKLVEVSDNLEHFERQRLLDFLETKISEVKFTTTAVWDELRKMLHHHRSHPDAHWSLPEEVLQRYERFYYALEPKDDIEKIWWLFTEHWPNFPEGHSIKTSYSERAQQLQERRTIELTTIYKNHGLMKILELLEEIPENQAHILGFTLANIVTDEQEFEELAKFLKVDDKHLVFIQTFLHRKLLANTKKWVFDYYEKLKALGYDSATLAKIFVKLPADRELWNFVAQTDDVIIDYYWKSVNLALFLLTVKDKEFGMRKLMNYGRFTSAVEEASHIADDLEKDTIIEVLYGFIKSEPEQVFRIHSYQIEILFDRLEQSEIDNATMIQLEWLYMPILGYSYGDTKTPRLHKEMSINPDFFMDVISLVYKSDNSVDDNSDQEKVVAAAEAVDDSESIVKADVAYQAYNLLNHWSSIPGVDEQLNIDDDALKNWVNAVRKKASEKGLLHAADNQIGSIFATFPEPNGKMEKCKPISWPPEPFCEILESSDSTEMLSGFSVNCYNKRGSSSRSAFDGGTREHHLVKYFKALAAERVTKYPKVAAVFEQLALGYEQEAKREDERAERDRLDY